MIARPLGIVQDLVEDGRTYTSYHKQLASGARVAEENEWDLTRTQVEAALFPNFHAEIVFASLTLDGAGMSGYGAYTLVLKEATISRRASVFEGNPYDLAERLNWLLTKPIPQGYRAIWSERNLLAQAKLHVELTPDTADVEFPAILARDGGGTGNSDFIEVHIYGALNKYAVAKVLGPKAATREDREILKRLGRKLIELGATLELR
ncbi:hypothetical protein CQW49_11985 [Methylosinus trichosporium OB3b]|uniref:Uncharacterized protein n=1 Tax=Methylosinus trichosporium (strain ATCC 35070 / NCIMB 11131 / UNIQEM 75 / OB3b) TaxID=595536 RepID=A0A2D2D0X4_METT3|nr:hypothetical protein CQW49_11985 [Methylosinus trichosporium OB3b]OBS53948.1 hypothetical protein A8B73_03050 [Methylosinus sp. 3S-1]